MPVSVACPTEIEVPGAASCSSTAAWAASVTSQIYRAWALKTDGQREKPVYSGLFSGVGSTDVCRFFLTGRLHSVIGSARSVNGAYPIAPGTSPRVRRARGPELVSRPAQPD